MPQASRQVVGKLMSPVVPQLVQQTAEVPSIEYVGNTSQKQSQVPQVEVVDRLAPVPVLTPVISSTIVNTGDRAFIAKGATPATNVQANIVKQDCFRCVLDVDSLEQFLRATLKSNTEEEIQAELAAEIAYHASQAENCYPCRLLQVLRDQQDQRDQPP